MKRYELNEAQWSRIAALLPGKVGDPGRTGSDSRVFVNGCLWVLRSGAHWCDLPERYGKWKTVHRRFSRYRNRVERCFNRLKHLRRFATRYDHTTIHFKGFVHLAAAMIWLR
nr:transposase [Agrobacterium sp. rho-8.1]